MKIFISYRRDDSSGYAGRLFDHLSAHFGPEHIFMDIDNIQPGEDFRKAIANAVGACDVVLAMIGRRWVNAADPAGQRRLDDPGDWVRVELATALANQEVRVIPVLVHGASMPGAHELPEDLKELAWRNAIELSDNRFPYDANRLIGVIERLGIRPTARPIPGRKHKIGSAKIWLPLLAITVLAALLAIPLLRPLLERTPSPTGATPVESFASPAVDTSSTPADQGELALLRSIPGYGQIASTAISPDGRVAAVGYYDGVIRLWSTYEDELLGTLNAGTTVISLAISRDNGLLAAGLTSSVVKVWRLDGSEIPPFEGLADTVYSVAFSPDGETLAAGDSRSVILWKVSDGTLLHTFGDYSTHITRLVFSSDGQMLASGSLGCTNSIKLLHVVNKTSVRDHASACGTAVAFSPDGEILATSGVFLWRVRDGARLHELAGHTQGVESLAFFPDGRTLLSVSPDVEVRRWQVSDGTRLYTRRIDGTDVHSVELSQDGRLLMTVHRDGTLKVWQIP